MLAIIGGTGLSQLSGFKAAGVQRVTTPYADKRVQVELFQQGACKLAFLPRHGKDHVIPPHRVNYRANLWALHKLGVDKVIAVNAVGGIHEGMAPGNFAVPDQIIDYTTGRAGTFFEDNLQFVTHIDFSEPFDAELRQGLLAAAAAANRRIDTPRQVMAGGVYACTQGPRLETAAEIRRLRQDGCDLVGMTAMPEAALARELKQAYAMLALSVNWAAGLAPGAISLEEIGSVVEQGMDFVGAVLEELVAALGD